MANQRPQDGRVHQWRCHGWLSAALFAILCLALAPPGLANAEEVALSIEPTMDRELDEALIASANLPRLLSGDAAPEPSSAAWTAAVTTETNRLAAILRAFGYLDGRIHVVTAEPISVRFRPIPGPLYRIGLVEVAGISDAGSEGEIANAINRAIGAPPRGDVLTGISDRVLRHVRSLGYPHAEIVQEVEVDAATATALVHLTVTLGPKVRLGPIGFYGAKATDSRLLSGLRPFTAGSDYKPSALEALRVAVENLPLVQRARVEMEERTDANGLVPVRVTIVERGDPSRLARLKLVGRVALIAALAALALRQWVQTAQRRPSVQTVQSLDLAVLVLLITGLALVLERALGFLK